MKAKTKDWLTAISVISVIVLFFLMAFWFYEERPKYRVTTQVNGLGEVRYALQEYGRDYEGSPTYYDQYYYKTRALAERDSAKLMTDYLRKQYR